MLRIITRVAPFALALFAVTLMALVLHPEQPPVHGQPLFLGAQIDGPTLALFQRSCQNCHSENTQWPWYSRIPPASWMIAKDIGDARLQVNFSRWNSYPAAEQAYLLTRISAAVRTRRMPLPRYTLLHREAVLTEEERKEISEWAKAEKKRLRTAWDSTSLSLISQPGVLSSPIVPARPEGFTRELGESRNDEQ